jgi:rhomboid protease GluP
MNQNPTPSQAPQPQPPHPPIQVAVPNVKPYATYVILGVTIFIYLLQLAGQYLLPASLANSFLATYGTSDIAAILGEKVDSLIRAGQLWRLITPVFLHDSHLPYGLLHIGFNMYALYVLGRGIESRFGHKRFLLLYFLSGYAGNVMSFLLTPNPSLGASTALFGLFSAEAVFVLQNRALYRDKGRSALMNIVSLVAINLFLGLSIPSVDMWGHVGGLLGGLLFAWFGGPRWKLEGFYPTMKLVDEREGHGSLAGTLSVLLFFIPLTALGWIWIVG